MTVCFGLISFDGSSHHCACECNEWPERNPVAKQVLQPMRTHSDCATSWGCHYIPQWDVWV